ncbi:hypothetical protein AB0A60_31750 [Streptomyces sp. NPDC046275]|uniref:hypothetical protein n=1 Tax=Streptomyces sp. NPDC046275 TaxID=3157201 RepID=UPI0033E2FCA1
MTHTRGTSDASSASSPPSSPRKAARPPVRGGRFHPQWEYEVTAGGRVRHLVDEERRTVHVVCAAPRHPEDTG